MSSALDLDRDRQMAARVAARADLRDVRMSKISAELFTPPDMAEVRLTYRMNHDVEAGRNEELLGVTGNYHIEIAPVPRDSEDATPDWEHLVASITFDLEALFTLDEDEGTDHFTDEEISAYARSTATFAMYPYARELVAAVSSRLALPQLTMGVLRFDMVDPSAEH